mmetsp:Transcript_52711/g.109973  ORF Transcript_52711/g.109973 Transcript_52711/m.109973 type:complete len:165 (-) Transcript_52711:210-704(-)
MRVLEPNLTKVILHYLVRVLRVYRRIHWAVYIGSVVTWFIFLLAYHAMDPETWGKYDSFDNVYFVIFELATMSLFWFTQLALSLLCITPLVAYKYFRESYDPGIDDYYRRVVNDPQRYHADGHIVARAQANHEAATGPSTAIQIGSSSGYLRMNIPEQLPQISS